MEPFPSTSNTLSEFIYLLLTIFGVLKTYGVSLRHIVENYFADFLRFRKTSVIWKLWFEYFVHYLHLFMGVKVRNKVRSFSKIVIKNFFWSCFFSLFIRRLSKLHLLLFTFLQLETASFRSFLITRISNFIWNKLILLIHFSKFIDNTILVWFFMALWRIFLFTHTCWFVPTVLFSGWKKFLLYYRVLANRLEIFRALHFFFNIFYPYSVLFQRFLRVKYHYKY